LAKITRNSDAFIHLKHKIFNAGK